MGPTAARLRAGDYVMIPTIALAELGPAWIQAAAQVEFRLRADGLVLSEASMSVLEKIAEALEELRGRADPVADPDGVDEPPLTSVTMPKMNDPDTVIGLREAGRILGRAPESVRERCERGTLPHWRDDRERFIFRRSILEAS